MRKFQNIQDEIDFNIAHRKNSVDDTYFDKIDTEEKAYFLGLLYADGSNVQTPWCAKRICLALLEQDSYIIEKFKKATKFSGKIYKRKTGNLSKTYMNGIAINSSYMSYQLEKLGCRTE